MATKNPRARKPKEETKASNLLEALRFISVAQHAEGTPYQTHCRISNNAVTGFDGGLMAGHFVEESLNVCPHTHTLLAALAKCKESISITELDSGRLSIKSGKFRALVPCIPYADLQAVEPDSPCAVITDALKPALAACAPLAVDQDAEPFKCAVLLQAGTAVATNRHVLIEAWHGLDLPPGLLVPKAAVKAIIGTQKNLAKFGFSSNSATFYFEDDSFIKTQLYSGVFPDYKKIIEVPYSAWPLPGGFYEALDNITPFADKVVYFRNGKMCSHATDDEGANYEVTGLTNDLAFQIEYLRLIREHAHNVHFNATDRGLTLFFGENVRGGIMKYGN